MRRADQDRSVAAAFPGMARWRASKAAAASATLRSRISELEERLAHMRWAREHGLPDEDDEDEDENEEGEEDGEVAEALSAGRLQRMLAATLSPTFRRSTAWRYRGLLAGLGIFTVSAMYCAWST